MDIVIRSMSPPNSSSNSARSPSHCTVTSSEIFTRIHLTTTVLAIHPVSQLPPTVALPSSEPLWHKDDPHHPPPKSTKPSSSSTTIKPTKKKRSHSPSLFCHANDAC